MPRENRQRNQRRSGRRNVAPPPAEESRLERYFNSVPYIIFAITFFMALLEFIHGYLIEDLEKKMAENEDLVEKSSFDKTAHIRLIEMITEFRKMVDDR